MLREHEINQQNPFIRGYYTDTEVCDEIVKVAKQRQDVFYPEPGRDFKVGILENLPRNLRQTYLNGLFASMHQYKQEFPECYEHLEMWALRRDIKVQHYSPGTAYYDWHTENNGEAQYILRHLVYMTYLNDIEDEGGTEFLHQNIKIKPEKGLTLMWPADWTHTHRGVVSMTEEKYIATGWFVFDHTKHYSGIGVEE